MRTLELREGAGMRAAPASRRRIPVRVAQAPLENLLPAVPHLFSPQKPRSILPRRVRHRCFPRYRDKEGTATQT